MRTFLDRFAFHAGDTYDLMETQAGRGVTHVVRHTLYGISYGSVFYGINRAVVTHSIAW